MSAELHALKAQIESLSPSNRLRLAAELLEAKLPELAHTIAEKVVLDLGAALALANLRTEPTR